MLLYRQPRRSGPYFSELRDVAGTQSNIQDIKHYHDISHESVFLNRHDN